MTRRRAAVGALALALVFAGCADDGDTVSSDTSDDAATTSPTSATGAPTVTAASAEFPPNDVAAMKGIFDPLVEPLGLRFTRAALVDRSDGYEFSDTGSHLALYVEPIDDASYDIDDYVANIYELMAVVTPQVFGPYAGIQTYDICQEPYQAEDDGYEPFPVTQVEITREVAEAYDWESGDLASFLAFLDTAEDTKVQVNDDIKNAESFQTAEAEAGLD